jgi:methyl-accepting chemotaxis protein
VFKNMKLGLKMGLGFGLVIVLVIVVGGIAILNMLDIQKSSISLDSEYVPEVGIANNVERNSFLTMYGMRGYSLSFDEDYWQSSQESYKLVGKYLQEAKALAEKHPDLTALKEGTQAASSKAEEYGRCSYYGISS